jgi:hypothetical protein
MKQACLVLSGKRDTYWRAENATLWKGHRQNRFEVKIGNHLWSRRILWCQQRLNCCWRAWVWKWNFHETKLAWNRGDKWQSVLQFKLKQQSIWKWFNYFLKPQSLPSSLSAFIFCNFHESFFGKINISGFYKRSLSVTSTITDCPFAS